jgi:hypothetical protein
MIERSGDRADVAELLTGSDAGSLLKAASAEDGVELAGWSLRSVHHRGRRSVSAVYEATLVVDGGTREVLLVAHADSRPLPEGSFVLSSGGTDIAVWRFPYDPYLPGLRSAVHRRRVRELLDELDGPPGEVTLRTRAYRPSRRAVVEVTVVERRVIGRILYLKVLAGGRAAAVADVHRQLDGVVPVPAVIGVAREQGIVAFEALRGATLRSALVAGERVPGVEELIELSAALAGSGLDTTRDPTRFADPTRHVKLLRRLVPEIEPMLLRAAAAAGAVDGPVAPVHGDLHDAQVLVRRGAVVGLLDVDGAGTGRIAHDLGNLVAHLEATGETWAEARDRADAYAEEVAGSARRLVPAADLARAAAGAWLGLATGAYRAQGERWPELTRRRIARAHRWAVAADRG